MPSNLIQFASSQPAHLHQPNLPFCLCRDLQNVLFPSIFILKFCVHFSYLPCFIRHIIPDLIVLIMDAEEHKTMFCSRVTRVFILMVWCVVGNNKPVAKYERRMGHIRWICYKKGKDIPLTLERPSCFSTGPHRQKRQNWFLYWYQCWGILCYLLKNFNV